MHYSTEYEICALFFLIIITIRFFEIRRFPNLQNKIFGAIMFLAIADLSADIISSYTIEYANFFPAWVNYFINTLFYSLQLILSFVMLIYVVATAGIMNRYKKSLVYFSIPLVFFMLLLVLNPISGLLFYVDEINGILIYKRGMLFNTLYISPVLYLFTSILFTFKHKKQMQKKQSDAILCFILIIMAATFMQYMYPKYLITGVAITLAILMMFFTMQNPEDMLDLISGMFNYSAMMEFLRAQISENRDLFLVAVDIGGIRRINSAFGVEMGNQLLAKIGVFFNNLGGNIWSFRMIGTRFLITTSSKSEFQEIITSVSERFKLPWNINGIEVSLSSTIRYFGEPDFFSAPEEVVNLVDLAYSQVEADGWGTKKGITTDLLHKEKSRLGVESAMREALNSGEGFSLCYQPILDIKSGEFLSAEVLLRLNSPELGNISPSEFIPIAEKTGLILQIDEIVVKMACDFLRRNNPGNILGLNYLEINLSAAEFFQNPSVDIHNIIRKNGVSPNLICFEVTETAATVHQDILSDFMNYMINLGYRFALDDFGTGYANISRVLNLPFSIVKFDRMLLISDEEKNITLFDTMLSMFSRMGLQTVVEGVETAAQCERVIRLGGNHIQGYYYSKPLPEKEYLEFLEYQSGNRDESFTAFV